MPRPRLNVLRTFESAGRLLSFSRAAAEMNISQAAVSQQMRQLETYLGDKLFLRYHRRISLTGAGKAYLDAVHEALDRLDTVTDQLFSDRSGQVVNLRCSASVATLWLAPNLPDFQKSNPTIELRIKTLDFDAHENQGLHNELEIFVAGSYPDEKNVQLLLRSSVVPVAAPGLIETVGTPEQASDIQRFGLIHVLGYEDDWHRWFRTFLGGGTSVPNGLAVDSSLIAIEAAIQGQGVLLGRRPFIDSYLESGALVELFDEPKTLMAQYWLRRNVSARSARASAHVAQWLVALAEGKDI